MKLIQRDVDTCVDTLAKFMKVDKNLKCDVRDFCHTLNVINEVTEDGGYHHLIGEYPLNDYMILDSLKDLVTPGKLTLSKDSDMKNLLNGWYYTENALTGGKTISPIQFQAIQEGISARLRHNNTAKSSIADLKKTEALLQDYAGRLAVTDRPYDGLLAQIVDTYFTGISVNCKAENTTLYVPIVVGEMYREKYSYSTDGHDMLARWFISKLHQA